MEEMLFEEQLLKNCKPYLDEFKKCYLNGSKLPLRRGMLIEPSDDLTRIKVPQNRKPKNTLPAIHNAIDQWFDDNFNEKARSQSVFCTSSIKQTKEYGFPFLVFPIGNYTTIHSSKTRDIFLELKPIDILKDLGYEVDNLNYSNITEKINKLKTSEIYSVIDDKLKNMNFEKNKFCNALSSKNEIMLMCDEYYVAKNDNPRVLDFLRQYIKGEI